MKVFMLLKLMPLFWQGHAQDEDFLIQMGKYSVIGLDPACDGPCDCSTYPKISGIDGYCDDYTMSRNWHCDHCCAPGCHQASDCEMVTVVITAGIHGEDILWQVDGGDLYGGGSYSHPFYPSHQRTTQELCLSPGQHTLEYMDSYGDGWQGGTIEILDIMPPQTVESHHGTEWQSTGFSFEVGHWDCEMVTVTVLITTKIFGIEIRWKVDGGISYGPYPNHHQTAHKLCLSPGQHTLEYMDTYGDGWHDGTIEIQGILPPQTVESDHQKEWLSTGFSVQAPQTTIITGTMSMTVSDAQEFIANPASASAVADGLAYHLGCPSEWIVVQLSAETKRLAISTALRQLQQGSVHVGFEITVTGTTCSYHQQPVSCSYTAAAITDTLQAAATNAASLDELSDQVKSIISLQMGVDIAVVGVAQPTSTPVTQAPQAGAYGDPHCVNAKGDWFDIHAVGRIPMVILPSGTSIENSDFAVIATTTTPDGWDKCAPTFISAVDVWANQTLDQLRVDAGPAGDLQVKPMNRSTAAYSIKMLSEKVIITFRSVIVSVILNKVPKIDQAPFLYFDIEVAGLQALKAGGILGADPHDFAQVQPDGCSEVPFKHRAVDRYSMARAMP